MFTVKRIVNGDITLTSSEEVTLSTNGGKLFKEAVQLAMNPTSVPYEDLPEGADIKGIRLALPKGVEIEGIDEEVANMVVHQIVNVQERRDLDSIEPFVLTACAPGPNNVNEAIGVVVSHFIEDNVSVASYDFYYKGDEVYVVNEQNVTVGSLR